MKQIKLLKQNIRHLSRLLRGKHDPSWSFYQFERSVHSETWNRHDTYLDWALRCAQNAAFLEKPEQYEVSEDPIVRQGYRLAREARDAFHGKHRDIHGLRILVHVPPSNVSPGGHSLFANLLASLDYIGISVEALEWNRPIEHALQEFVPTILMTSDHSSYLNRIDWPAVKNYRRTHALKVGLTASPDEHGNTSLRDRLDWARRHDVSFYYSFQSPEHLRSYQGYIPFFEHGYLIHSVEFGANPLLYFPVPNIQRDINFVFLASSNQDKWDRYFRWLPTIVSHYSGMIDGPGWTYTSRWAPPSAHRFLYARAKIGLNLHIRDSIDWASELNERTYILAACGVPQLIDAPRLLSARFSSGCFFVAANEKEYKDLFVDILHDPSASQKKALHAQREVFRAHTTFHRAEELVSFLSGL